MPGKNQRTSVSFADMLLILEQVGAEHGVRLRVSVVPLPDRFRKQRHAILVTPYAANGRKLDSVAAQQLLWPSASHRTFEGAVVYLTHRLDADLDAWLDQQARRDSSLDYGAPSPIEAYPAQTPVS